MINIKSVLICFAVVIFTLTGCQQSISSQNDKTIIRSCNLKDVKPIKASLSMQEKTDVCRIMVASLRRNPPVYLVKDLFRLVAMVKDTASDDSATMIASKAMSVIVTRHQTHNDQAIQNTFWTLWQIYQGTQTQVTFQDLNVKLRQANANDQPLTDEGLIKVGIMLWRSKQMHSGAV